MNSSQTNSERLNQIIAQFTKKMKSIFSILLLTAITISYPFAQSNQLNQNSVMTYQNVKTQSVDVNGTTFFYRKLGENNSGMPIIFLNHLAATMDNCDPRIMEGLASKHQVICFDNRGVGATKGKTP